MNNSNITDSVISEQIINLLLNNWTAQNKAVTSFFNKYEDEVYSGEVAPGRNSGTYLFGHLIATHDGLLPLLGFGERLFPILEAPFILNPDGFITEIPTMVELREYWETVNLTLARNFASLQPQQWLEKHTKVSEADFATDPKRNKLNVLIGRISHQHYHFGQLTFLVEKELVG